MGILLVACLAALNGRRCDRDNDVDVRTDELGGHCRQALALTFCRAHLEGDGLPFDPAAFAKGLAERGPGSARGSQPTDPIDLFGLLRLGDEWCGEHAEGEGAAASALRRTIARVSWCVHEPIVGRACQGYRATGVQAGVPRAMPEPASATPSRWTDTRRQRLPAPGRRSSRRGCAACARRRAR